MVQLKAVALQCDYCWDGVVSVKKRWILFITQTSLIGASENCPLLGGFSVAKQQI